MHNLTNDDLRNRLTSWRIFFEREADPSAATGADPTPHSVALEDGEWDVDRLMHEAHRRASAELMALAGRVALLAELYTDTLDVAEAATSGYYDPTYTHAGPVH